MRWTTGFRLTCLPRTQSRSSSPCCLLTNGSPCDRRQNKLTVPLSIPPLRYRTSTASLHSRSTTSDPSSLTWRRRGRSRYATSPMTNGHEVGPLPADGHGSPDCGAWLLAFWHLWRCGCIVNRQMTGIEANFQGPSSPWMGSHQKSCSVSDFQVSKVFLYQFIGGVELCPWQRERNEL